MQTDFDVNPAFVAWRSSTDQEREWRLQELISRLQRYAKTICWQRLADHKDDFDILVNGIVWRAIKHASKFRDDSKFSTWFHRIAINECNRYLRNAKGRLEIGLDEDMPTRAEALDARIDLIALLETLTGEDHLLFRLVAEGQDFNSIAKVMGLKQRAALVRWTRLKRRLRDARGI